MVVQTRHHAEASRQVIQVAAIERSELDAVQQQREVCSFVCGGTTSVEESEVDRAIVGGGLEAVGVGIVSISADTEIEMVDLISQLGGGAEKVSFDCHDG